MTFREFSYQQSQAFPDLQGLPYAPITLRNKEHSLEVSALVDSGSTLNVLPFDLGTQLGFVWEEQTYALPSLVGSLKGLPAFGVLLEGQIDGLTPAPLAFAWTKSNDIPVILGQINFFSQFDVFFFGSSKKFQIREKQEDKTPP